MKKLIGALVGTGLLLATTLPAFAADESCSTNTSGPYSSNYCVKVKANIAAARVRNRGFVLQATLNSADTGNNVADGNTIAGGAVTTGGATSGALSSASLNTNTLGVTQSGGSSGQVGNNNITGPYSLNWAVLADVNVALVGIENQGAVIQYTSSSANTGGNSSSGNTIGGSIGTGDASSTAGSSAILNSNNVTISQ